VTLDDACLFHRPLEFAICQHAPEDQGGCTEFGGSPFQKPATGNLLCEVLSNVDCLGDRVFVLKDQPCIKYEKNQITDLFVRFTGKYFLHTLVLAIFVGLFGADRFYANHICFGIFKLISLGGIGVWWILDIILLVTGVYYPGDGSSWTRLY
jgi:hypothetical protein